MSKICAKCEKPVYPTEELKCLEKVWHKGCFKCWECGMTLNMKNYKGYDKKPYCSAHYPTTKFTAVVDTPEHQRLTQNSKIQSQAEYHKDFDNSKYTFVADSSDQERLRKNSQLNSNIEYRGLRNQHNDMENRRPNVSDNRLSGMLENSEIETHSYTAPYGARSSNAYNISEGVRVESSGQRRVGSIADYDPMNNNFGSIAGREWEETTPEPTRQPTGKPAGAIGIQVFPMAGGGLTRGPPRQSAPVVDDDAPRQAPQQVFPQAIMQQARMSQQPEPQQPTLPPNRPTPSGAVYQAMYDYVAADKDEVSFSENDIIIDVDPIDEGWMFGTVKRTGLRGMLPSNYVEKVQ